MYVLAEYSKSGNEFRGLLVRITGEVSIFHTLDDAKEQLKTSMIPGESYVKILVLNQVEDRS